MDSIYEITLLGFMFLELALAFIYFPYDTGMNFYKLKMGQVETAGIGLRFRG